MTPTTVVHVNDVGGYDLYIGRGVPRRGLARSIWANPYPLKPGDDRDAVLEMFRWYLDSQLGEQLRAKLGELRGKRLACWCKPEDGFRGRLLCHGQILAGLADGVPPESIG